MTASGTDGKTAPRSGSLLSLAPRPSKRRAAKPVLNPMLAALARAPETPAESPQGERRNDPPQVAEKPVAEQAPLPATPAPTPIPEKPTEAATEAPAAQEAAATREPAAEEAVAKDSAAGEPLAGPPAPDNASSKQARAKVAPGPETAKGLVERLRRQFVEGMPEGRAVAEAAPETSDAPEADTPPARSKIDELRLRLGEFRTEILVRAAGRGRKSPR